MRSSTHIHSTYIGRWGTVARGENKFYGARIHQTKIFENFFSIDFPHESDNFNEVDSHPIKFIVAPFHGNSFFWKTMPLSL